MLCLWVPGYSQETVFTVKGELQSGTTRFYSEYLVELVDTMHRTSTDTVDVGATGFFEIRKVPAGERNSQFSQSDARLSWLP